MDVLKKKILIILTGGTITMDAFSNSINISDNILNKINSSIQKTNINLSIDLEVFSSIPSPHFSCEKMLSLCKFIDKKISMNLYSGFVIAHGTDTIEETSFFLELYFSKSSFPIVFTGAMKNYFDESYDGFDNLISSVIVCSKINFINFGVSVVFNNLIFSSIFVSKLHTKNLDSFKSINFPEIGRFENGDVSFFNFPKRYSFRKINSITSKVYIYKTYSGDSGESFQNYVNIDFDAIVVEGFGSGNVPLGLSEFISNFISKNKIIAITSRVPYGLLDNFYDYAGGGNHLKKIGCIFDRRLNTQKMRIFLIYLISLGFSFDDLKKYILN